MKRWSMLLASMFVSSAVIAYADQMQDTVDALNRMAADPTVQQPGMIEKFTKMTNEYSSVNQMSRRAVEPGAVYQLKLQIRPAALSEHLSAYASVYLPVDQFVCDDPAIKANASVAAKCESSGRKLLSVLSREHGDEYNVVFLYRYESAYKEDYYCQYPKAFLLYHAAHATALVTPDAAKPKDTYPLQRALAKQFARDKAKTLNDLIAWLPASCSMLPPEGSPARVKALAALAIVQDLLQEIDLFFSLTTVASQDSWYFDVSLCKAGALRETPTTDDGGLTTACPEFRQSILERAAGLDWGGKWTSKH